MQGVAVLGDYSCHDLDHQYAYEHRYSFRTFHPPLKIISVPEGSPAPISEALERSFALFWSDHAACAGVVRVAIEALAEHLGQPRMVGDKFVPFGVRLNNLKSSHPDVAEAGEANKNIGNVMVWRCCSFRTSIKTATAGR
ncbi:MAG: hypothetical protein K2Y27_35265 [Xanthobacteraceae bacterium]|nr:hypothetical protein [Xanthobacteraceae bacterium]